MQTLTVCATKGGAGKTTLATCLAIAAMNDGQRVALIDIDPQQSMRLWWEDRGEPNEPTLVTWDRKLGVKYLPSALERVAEAGFDLVVIDTPPAIMSIIELSVSNADFVLIPSQASSADIIGNRAAIELVTKHQKPFAFVVNRAEPRDSAVQETIAFFKEHGAVITTTVGNRRIYRTAYAHGNTGPEMDRGKARQEITAVWNGIKKQVRAAARKAA